jgi:hypothetical protein
MKLPFKIFFILFFSLLLIYVLIPAPEFPNPPSDSIQSNEPADSETPLRRAYFTNLTREEVMKHYKDQFSKPTLFGIPLPTYSFNYPPEESQTIIRDQTRSTFLEEIVHPFRESIYVNGFEPKTQKDAIFIEGRSWRQKLIIKYVGSMALVRAIIVFLTAAFTYLTILELKKFTKEFNFKRK